MTIPQLPFYFIRHGETDWNRGHVYMGTTDIPLNQTGVGQAELAAQWLKDQPITHIATSSLSRAVKTAKIIAESIQKPITVIDNLKECHWGVKEGQPVDICTFFDQWIDGDTPEGAEAACDFDARVKRGLIHALGLSKTVLIVAHGGVCCSIQRTLSLPLMNIKNCVPICYRPPEHPGHSWSVCGLGGEVKNNVVVN
ncbi:MAG: histidine phosphatase family protein [Pseudomonadota bacterium]